MVQGFVGEHHHRGLVFIHQFAQRVVHGRERGGCRVFANQSVVKVKAVDEGGGGGGGEFVDQRILRAVPSRREEGAAE